MTNTLIPKIKKYIKTLEDDGVTGLPLLNGIKEYLQYTVLNYVYNSKKYSNLKMYGGTLLRICYDLPRLSEDLDFQTSNKINIKELGDDLIEYYKETFNFDLEVLVKERINDTDVLTLKYEIIKDLDIDLGFSKVNLRFDINKFDKTDLFNPEIIPIYRDEYSFSIRTYPISTLMASKIAAVLLRTDRGIGSERTDNKPRDIYDLLWYMEKQIIPDLTYLRSKQLNFKDQPDLFNTLSIRVSNLKDNLFEKDLAQFFYKSTDFEIWFRNWRDRYMLLCKKYSIQFEITNLISIHKKINHNNESIIYTYKYATKDEYSSINFQFTLSRHWFIFSDVKIKSGHRIAHIENKIDGDEKITELDKEYLGLFYIKIEDYLKRNKFLVSKQQINTKFIRVTTDKLNLDVEVILDNVTLIKARLEDLL